MRKFLLILTFFLPILIVSIICYKNNKRDIIEPLPPVQDLFSPLPPFEEPKEVIPVFIEVPKFRNISEDSVYGDVLNHSKDRPFGDRHGRATNVHETAHDIHSYLRNTNNGRVNGFYCLEGRAAIIEEPNIRKSQINSFVPKNLRSYRYNLYLVGQREWDDTPLYIYDEWVAYVLDGKCNVDDVQSGRYKGGWVDGVSGCLGFSIYSIALCMAVKEYDPQYWESNEQFRNFTIWMLKESQKTFMLGREMNQFKWDKQDNLLNELLTSNSAEPMREFIAENLENVWLDSNVKSLNYLPHQQVELKISFPY